jgi:hypothetical protein
MEEESTEKAEVEIVNGDLNNNAKRERDSPEHKPTGQSGELLLQSTPSIEGPVRPVPPAVPKPEHLLKTASPLTNDPLWLEAFVIEGDKGPLEDAGVKRFTYTHKPG